MLLLYLEKNAEEWDWDAITSGCVVFKTVSVRGHGFIIIYIKELIGEERISKFDKMLINYSHGMYIWEFATFRSSYRFILKVKNAVSI